MRVLPGAIVLVESIIYFTLGTSVIRVFPKSLVLDYRNPLESLANPPVFCKVVIFLTLSVLSFLMLSFLLDPGRALMSGRKDYEDFIKDYEVFYGI